MENTFNILMENEGDRIKNSLSSYIRNSLSCSTVELLNSDFYRSFKIIVKSQIKAATSTKEFSQCIYNEIEKIINDMEKKGTTFKEVLPKGFENNLKVYLYNQSPTIIAEVKKIVRSKDTEKRIKIEINKFMSGLNPLAAKFVNGDSLYIKIVQGIDNYFNNIENTREFIESASKIIDNGVNRGIGEVTMYFPFEGKKAFIESIGDFTINTAFCDTALDQFIKYFEEVFKTQGSLYNMMLKITPDLDQLVEKEGEEIFNYIKSN